MGCIDKQKITISELYAAGFESLVSDYKYVLDSKNKFVTAYTPESVEQVINKYIMR